MITVKTRLDLSTFLAAASREDITLAATLLAEDLIYIPNAPKSGSGKPTPPVFDPAPWFTQILTALPKQALPSSPLNGLPIGISTLELLALQKQLAPLLHFTPSPSILMSLPPLLTLSDLDLDLDTPLSYPEPPRQLMDPGFLLASLQVQLFQETPLEVINRAQLFSDHLQSYFPTSATKNFPFYCLKFTMLALSSTPSRQHSAPTRTLLLDNLNVWRNQL